MMCKKWKQKQVHWYLFNKIYKKVGNAGIGNT